ncbi:hypothetical protein SB783_28025 [Paraburkholderia sp. SIMBA_009]|uniref:Uncharacterized protein n=1 Tax=Paraburkholderia tropica TaxID=92647 RepID=A0AAQ1JY26_9BURK|nr:hypothetical protein [Paraburkholderia tropica]RQN36227.1 hypothetical protein EHZ25_24735 [Paraburkholderia tropica]SEK14081.1 hypothetical protein SAMN05216550_12664 [Paraburkholderia tropica]
MMDGEKNTNIGAIVGRLLQQMIELGLTWEQAVAVFGIAAKALAQAAASANGKEATDYREIARQGLLEAFDREVNVVVTNAGLEQNENEMEGNALLAIAQRRNNRKYH